MPIAQRVESSSSDAAICGDAKGQCTWAFVETLCPITDARAEHIPLPYMSSIVTEPPWSPFGDDNLCKLRVCMTLDARDATKEIHAFAFAIKFLKCSGSATHVRVTISSWDTDLDIMRCVCPMDTTLHEIGRTSRSQTKTISETPGVRVHLRCISEEICNK